MVDYELTDGEIEIYRGKQWIVTNYGMRAVVRRPGLPASAWIYRLERRMVGGHCLNRINPDFEYSSVSHIEKKQWADLEDFIIAFRVACSYYEIDTAGWLNREIEHAREKRRYSDAAKAMRAELFPNRDNPFRTIEKLFKEEDMVAAELAKRGIVDPDVRSAHRDGSIKPEKG